MTTIALAGMGDSLTAPYGYGNTPADTHLYRLVALLRAKYPAIGFIMRGYGIGGNTTAQMVARFGAMTQYEVPNIGILYGGANDGNGATTVNGTATTTSVPLQAGLGTLYGAGSWIQVAGASAQVLSVSGDTLTLTAATALASAPASGAAVAIDTRRNLAQMGKLLLAAGCKRMLVHGQHMKNWATGQGGDTLTTEESYYASCRVAQQGAVADLVTAGADAVYVDNLAAMRALISSGAEAANSNCWAPILNNQHLNCTRTRADAAGRAGGHDVLAANAFAALKPVWLAG
jgi:hypothetical protein